MKKTLAVIIISLTMLCSASAQNLTSLDVLIRAGMQVKMGELTGAGSRFSVKDLEGLILPEGVLMIEDCFGVVIKTTVNPKISDIVKIKVDNQEVLAEQFIGFVVR